MANAATRNKAQQSASKAKAPTRAELLEKLSECDRKVLIAYVKANNLPKATAEWSDDMVAAAVAECHPIESKAAASQEVVVEEEQEQAPVVAAPKPKADRQVHQLPPAPSYAIVHDTDDEATTLVYQFKNRDAAVELVNGLEAGKTGYVVRRLEDMKPVPMAILLAVTNKTAQTPIKKFANPDAARESAFNALPNASAETAKKARGPKAPSTPATPRVRKPVFYAAKPEAKPVRAGSKVANLIDLLAREEGASMEEIEAELSKTGKAVNGRSWLGYDLVQKGYGAQEGEDGRIRLLLPKGMTAPHAHTTSEPKGKKGGSNSADTMVGADAATEGPYTAVEEVPEVVPAAKTGTAKKSAAKKAPAKKAASKK